MIEDQQTLHSMPVFGSMRKDFHEDLLEKRPANLAGEKTCKVAAERAALS